MVTVQALLPALGRHEFINFAEETVEAGEG